MWLVDSLAWVLRLRCNLTDFEIQEYATLSASLSIVRFRLVPNSWRWNIDPSSTFFVKSLIDDLTGSLEHPARDLHFVIWLDHYPKKIKILCWELCHGVINTVDRLQHRMPYMSLYPTWCLKLMLNLLLICSCIVLLCCSSGITSWMLLDGPTAHSINIFNILDYLLVRHPSTGNKKMVWLAILCTSFWTCGASVVSVSFGILFPLLIIFFDLVLFMAFYWCSTPFF